MGTRLNYSGLVVAGIGFVLTRFTVTLALYDDPVRFYFAGVVPLMLGLGLAAFGVSLVVVDVEASLVRTTAIWCVVGTGTMLVLVLLTLLGSSTDVSPSFTTMRSRTYLSNFLIGGSVGGTLTGLYASRTRRQRRALQQQTNRLEVLNRILRHEVLNALNVIRGYATVDGEETDDASAVIEERTSAIAETIEEVKYLTRSATANGASLGTTDLAACLTASVETVRARHPDAEVSVGPLPEATSVRANNLERVFTHLLENAVVHATVDAPEVAVTVSTTSTTVRIDVSDEGPGLPEPQQTLLETGEITEFDDPRDGYGLNVVQLLVESVGGAIETDVSTAGTTIAVVLPRGERSGAEGDPGRSALSGTRPSVPHLTVILAAALFAGVPYGLVSEQFGGSVAAIGVFYGVNDPVVGWITHEFHSAVFAFVFAGLVSFAPERYRTRVLGYVLVGVAWALFLWVVAAGLVAPTWLLLLGISVPIPSFSPVLLGSHLVWGVSLGLFTALGYRYAAPWLARLGERLRRSGDD